MALSRPQTMRGSPGLPHSVAFDTVSGHVGARSILSAGPPAASRWESQPMEPARRGPRLRCMDRALPRPVVRRHGSRPTRPRRDAPRPRRRRRGPNRPPDEQDRARHPLGRSGRAPDRQVHLRQRSSGRPERSARFEPSCAPVLKHRADASTSTRRAIVSGRSAPTRRLIRAATPPSPATPSCSPPAGQDCTSLAAAIASTASSPTHAATSA